MARMILTAGNSRIIRIGPIITNMAKKPALLGSAAAGSFQAVAYVPKEADVIQE